MESVLKNHWQISPCHRNMLCISNVARNGESSFLQKSFAQHWCSKQGDQRKNWSGLGFVPSAMKRRWRIICLDKAKVLKYWNCSFCNEKTEMEGCCVLTLKLPGCSSCT